MWLASILNASLGIILKKHCNVIKLWSLCRDTHSLGCQSLPSLNTKRFLELYVHKQIIWQQGNLQVAVIRRAFAATFFQRRRRRSSRAAAVHADGQVSFAQAVSGVRRQHLKHLHSFNDNKHWFHIRGILKVSKTHGSVGTYGPILTFSWCVRSVQVVSKPWISVKWKEVFGFG